MGNQIFDKGLITYSSWCEVVHDKYENCHYALDYNGKLNRLPFDYLDDEGKYNGKEFRDPRDFKWHGTAPMKGNSVLMLSMSGLENFLIHYDNTGENIVSHCLLPVKQFLSAFQWRSILEDVEIALKSDSAKDQIIELFSNYIYHLGKISVEFK